MTPKEQANDLIRRFKEESYSLTDTFKNINAKKCALVCVDVILNDCGAKDWEDYVMTNSNYWKDVKVELENYDK